MGLLTIEEPDGDKSRASAWTEHPVLRLGFRPFYLLAAAFAAVSVPVWIARYFGALPALTHIDLNWHMHEMVFGFAIAVVIGFLFTAGRAWTGHWTPRRAHLAALAALWIAGRIGMLSGVPLLAAVLDLSFLPLTAWPMYRVLQRSGNRRNLFLIVLLSILSLFNLAFHLSVSGWISWSPMAATEAAILVIVLLESVIGARVIPMFTINGAPGTKPIVHVMRDRICIGLTIAACIAWIFGLPPAAIAAFTFAAACSQLLRLAGWQPQRTLHQPLLWILHLSYAWIAIGFALMGLAALQVVSVSAAFHALAVGSMAGLIIGMMTRTALGHTGRPLRAGRSELAMYLLIQLGAVARLIAALDTGGLRDGALMIAGAAWGVAFLLYVLVYGPYLCRLRIDGKEG